MTLNLEKTKITHAQQSAAHFLGTDIRATPLDKRPLRFVRRGNEVYRSKTNTLHAPVKKLVHMLEERGFAKAGGSPTRNTRMIHFEVAQIVNHFWQIWQGISNYYSFADNYGRLGKIHFILKYSCVLTLASKLKLKSAKKVFTKFGKDIVIRNGKGKMLASFPNVLLAKPKKFLITPITKLNPFNRLEKISQSYV